MSTDQATDQATDQVSLKVSWELPSDICYKAQITGHMIQYGIAGSNDEVTRYFDKETTHTISELNPCAKYSVKVAAMNANGHGPFSKPKQQTTGKRGEFNFLNDYICSPMYIIMLSCI